MATPPPTAVQRVHGYVKERVFSNEFADGTMLSEGQVAEALGVSRTPVREAFVQLEAQGFLRLYPKRGALVVPVSREDMDAVIETRWVIERHAIERLVEHPDPAVTGAMLAVIEEQRRLLDAGDMNAFSAIDRDFHRAPVQGTGNAILIELYDSLRDRQRRMNRGMVQDDPARGEVVVTEHRAILAAIEAGKASKALRLLKEHMESARVGLLASRATGS